MLISLFILIFCIGCIVIIPFSCRLYKIAQSYVTVDKNLPDTFRIELPLQIDHKGYFCITARINHQQDVDFIIDTQAGCLAKKDDLENLNADYRGLSPFPTRNIYGRSQRLPLYSFDGFEIHSLSFEKPLFTGIDKMNNLYDIMYRNILGTNILSNLFWKFSVDEGKMILFREKDTALIEKEVEGYTKIERGLFELKDVIIPFSPVHEQENFLFDLGYRGEIGIDKKIYAHLSKQISHKKILTIRGSCIDSTYVFEGVNIQWNGITVPNCQLIHSPLINRNLIGVQLMHRFNFVLAYDDYMKARTQRHLYINPVKNFQNLKSVPYISSFGFNIKELRKEWIVSGLEVGGLAELSGLKINDRIIRIDNGAFNLENNNNDLIMYLADKKQVTVQIEREGEVFDIKITKD
jgi:hypothetical protein